MTFTDDELKQLLIDMASIYNKLTDETFVKKLSGDVLSYTAVKLAALKASTLDLKTEAERDMLRKEVAKDTAKGKAYAKYKASDGATAASDMKNMDEDYIQARDEYNESVVLFNRLKSINSNVHDMIESLRGRTIEMQGSRKDEGTK